MTLPLTLSANQEMPPGGKTTLLLVAEHALIRAGLRTVLDATPGFAVVAEACNLENAVALARSEQPHVVLVSLGPESLADRAGLVRVREQSAGACLLLLGDESTVDGEFACLPSSAGVEDFCTAVGVLRGGACAACVFRARCPAPRLAIALSRREREVAVSIAAGMSSKQIAGALGIALRTVNTYRESLARKVGASSAAVLTRYVIEAGLDCQPA